jgi:hypothetical protein
VTRKRCEASQWDALRRRIRAGWRCGRSPTIRRTSGTNPFTIEIILGLVTKACKTFRSIQILGERGLREDANALVRVLLETTVAVLFILQRRRRDKKTKVLSPTAQQRALTFYAYSKYQQLKMLADWKKTCGPQKLCAQGKAGDLIGGGYSVGPQFLPGLVQHCR